MWKSYDRFYSQTLKSEASLLLLSKNVHEVPRVSKISVTCLPKAPYTMKGILMALSSLQLLVNKKAKLVTANKSIVLTKVRKGQPLGATISITRGAASQFLNFLTFIVMPQLDLTKLLPCSKKSVDFKLFIRTPTAFSRLTPFFNFFQFLPPIQVVCSLKKGPSKGHLFFLRLMKLPLALPPKN